MRSSRIPLVRLLRLDRAVRTGTYPSAPALARNLGVSTRTVQRDVEYLRQLGAPIRWNASRKGYEYADSSYVPGFDVELTEGDLLSVLAAETILPAYRGTPYEGVLRKLFLKVGKAFGAPMKIKMADLAANTPAASRKAPRGARARLPRSASPGADGSIAVVLRFSPSVTDRVTALEWPEESQLQTLMDGGLELTIETEDADEVLRWMLQWGTDVEVISPRWARRRLLQILDMIRNRYQPAGAGPRRKAPRARSTAARRKSRPRTPSLRTD
jgi:predicted DNA-binding transcriptional regulator YafY